MKTRLVSLIIGLLVVAGIAPAAAETTGQTKTVVTVDAGAVVAFDFFNIRVSALWPATGTTPTYTFPSRSRNGSTELAGGMKFTANEQCFVAYAPVISSGVVKAWVNGGKRIDLFTLNGQSLVLTSAGAQALNDGLGFTGLFSQGFVFGTYV